MAKPSTAFSWTTVATYRDAIPSGVRDSGFIPNTLVSSGYTNQALFEIGEWVTYLSDLSPADNVLAFREWECPDDSSYQLAWNGPAGVDGLFQGDVHSWSVLADTATMTQGFDSGSGDTSTVTFDPTGSTGRLRTNATGWAIGVIATDPTSPTDDAGIEVDADSGDVTLFSDYGTVTIPADTQTASTSYVQTVVPACAWVEAPSIASTVAIDASFPYLEISGSTSAEVIGWIDIQGGVRRIGVTDTIESLSVKHGAVGGSVGGAITFTLYRMATSGPAAVSGATLTLSQGDSADTTSISIAPETVSGGESLFVAVSVNGTAVTAEIEVIHTSYASTHLR